MPVRTKPFSSAKLAESRKDPEMAGFVLRDLQPDSEKRRQFEELLADLIEVAATKNPSCCVVTLRRKLVGLNVGPGRVLSLWRGSRVTFYALAEGMPADLQERLERHRPETGPYKTEDPVVGFTGPFDVFLDLLEGARPYIVALANRWTWMKSIWKSSHSPGVIEWLEQELGRSLPRAEFDNSVVPEGSHDGELDTEGTDIPNAFSWRGLYSELAERLLEYSDDRKSLLSTLHRLSDQGLKIVSLEDRDEEDGPPVPLEDIDPFSVFACFNRGITDENRKAVLDALRRELELESPLPTDFSGIPVVHNQAARFLTWAYGRSPQDIQRLWSLAEAAVEGGREAVDAEEFDAALEQKSVAITKLTAGLFWLNPEQFLSVDGPMMAYLERHGIGPKPRSWSEYTNLLEQVEARLGIDFPMISYLAWAEGSPIREGRRFWAGGIQWGDSPEGNKLEEFLREGYWQHGYAKDTDRPAGKRCWERIATIAPGDHFALKGIGGRNDLVVHAIGEVRKVDVDRGVVDLQILQRNAYRGKAPTGPGAGAWRETLLEVTREDVIEKVFGVDKLALPTKSPGPGAVDESASTWASFEALEARLAKRNLRFPTELVASYLLALQAKRLVILTGISGTGKTQLSIEVAKHFGAERDVPDAPKDWEEDPHIRRVVSSLFKYGSAILPKAFREAEAEFMDHAREQRRYPIRFEEEDGGWEASIRIYAEGGPPSIGFPKAMQRRIEEEFEVGDLLRLGVDGDAETGYRLQLQKIGGEGAAREARPRYVVVAVRPDWTDNRGLLGFHNPITDRYHVTPFLRLLLEAAEEQRQADEEGIAPRPYFAVLDEMNLARVEHYFSDFLSCLESREALCLHEGEEFEDEESGLTIPPRLKVPQNLFFTGTVNVDETTYMFSPKVLDRAFALEFNLVDLRSLSEPEVLNSGTPLRLTSLPAEFAAAGQRSAGDWNALAAIGWSEAQEVLIELNDLLAVEHRHYGYRVATEIARFLCLAQEQTEGGPKVLAAALDVALLSKVLPKLHGTQQELEDVLTLLFEFAIGEGHSEDIFAGDSWSPSGTKLLWKGEGVLEARFPRTALKLWRMRRRLHQQGFTSFVE